MRLIQYFNQTVSRISTTLPWTNVVGLARTMLALGTLITLLANGVEILFPTYAGQPVNVNLFSQFTGIDKLNFFLMFGVEHFELTRWLAVLGLMVIASGWRPRITCLFHWWISYSFFKMCFLIDGGDHLTSILTLLLVPVCLTDNRKWHWQNDTRIPESLLRKLGAMSAWSFSWVIRLQIAILYFNASVAKMAVTEWADGTALYYWFTDPFFGMASWMYGGMMPLLSHPFWVTMMTWGVILFELVLFLGLVIDKKYRGILLGLGLFFHLNIILVHGLVSFFFAIGAGLILFLRPLNQPFVVQRGYKNYVTSVSGIQIGEPVHNLLVNHHQK